MSATDRQMQAARDGRIDQALARVSNSTLRQGNALTLLENGPDTYDDWIAAIGRAQHWVHLENYIFKGDHVGQRFAEALAERAAAGVRVRVLYDWFGSLGVPRAFYAQMRRAGVDVRPFNPPTVGAPLDVVQRDHRKLLAVDGVYASVGGVCIADEWLIRSPETGLPYRDTAVRVLGPAIADFESAFADVWNEAGPALPIAEQLALGAIEPAGDVPVRVIVQEPGRLRMLRVLQLLTAAVQRRLWIADAYFLVTPILRESLMAAARDGVDVRILLPSTNDVALVAPLSRYSFRPMLEAGIKIWEYAGPMMHAKTTVADGWWARIGSTNLNITGLVTNWEIDLVAEDQRFGAMMEAMFERDLGTAREIRLGGGRRALPQGGVGRPRSRAERRAQRRARRRGGSGTGATVARVGQTALQVASGDVLQRNERMVGAAVGATVLATSLLGARFPRAIVWPLAAIGSAFGSISLIRAIRPSDPDGPARRPQLWQRRPLPRVISRRRLAALPRIGGRRPGSRRT